MHWKLKALTGCLAAICIGGYFTLARPTYRRDPASAFLGDKRPVSKLCSLLSVPYPPHRVFLRVFKQEREMELWGEAKSGEMKLLRVYTIAAAAGGPGPKRRQGDSQVPEGVYRIDRFNPHSQYLLSLGLNYPNKADRIVGDRERPGSDIFIHGNQVSDGCLAMTDEKIPEIYSLASSAASPVAVHIFPCRMEGESYARLKRGYPRFAAFWQELEPIYASFQAKRVLPKVSVDRKGSYRLN